MKKFSVVMGTNYGDEGKGLTTDWLSGSDNPNDETRAVARFCGGANAGHTVELDDGTRHVFGHLGSGTLCDLTTILTRDFIVNPILFWKEKERLGRFSPVIVDPRCRVSTPLDVILNQEKERTRDNNRHGSTGVGINETVARNESGVHLTVEDLKAKTIDLAHIKEYFQREIRKINPEYDFSSIDESLKRFIVDAKDFIDYVYIHEDEKAISHHDHVIFEGSQGIMLDENSDDFPHVTRASTGTTNLVKFFEKFSDREINLYYITRSYLTRHGAGPMRTQQPDMYFYDQTNQPNEFQGTMKFGKLDFERMQDVVLKDLKNVQPFLSRTSINTMMTWYNEEDRSSSERFAQSINAHNQFVATGKTRSSVIKL
ncbi:2-aminooxy adenylosuccinate synthetase [Vibrio phage VB_VaC_TDDLMA]